VTTQEELPPVHRPTGRDTLTGSHFAGAARGRPHEAKWFARAPHPAPGFVATMSDSFNRSDRPLGGTSTEVGGGLYVNFLGTPSITNNQMARGGVDSAIIDMHSPDHFVEAQFFSGPCQLGTRFVDTNNRFGLYWDGSKYDLYKAVGGAFTFGLIPGSTPAFAPGDKLKVTNHGDDVKVYLNDVLLGGYTNPNPELRGGTSIVLVTQTVPGLDNFRAGVWQ
jgi:hypothetical protein